MFKLFTKPLIGLGILALCISCQEDYPEIQSVRWAQEMDRGSLQYFSPSMVQAGLSLDEANTFGPVLNRVYDFSIFRIPPEMEDEYVYKPICTKFLNDIDSLGLKPIIPSFSMDSSTVKILGNSEDGNVNYILVCIDHRPGFDIYEVRGDSLQKSVSDLVFKAMLSGGNLSIPFFN